MKKRLEKLSAGLLALVLILTMLPAAGAVDTDPCAEGHTWEERVLRENGHLRQGLAEQVCTVCGLKGSQRLLPREEHTFLSAVPRAATAEQEGVLANGCTTCGEVYYSVIPKLTAEQAAAPDCGEGNHDFEEVLLDESNCRHCDATLEICRVCGATGEAHPFQLMAHVFETEVLQPATAEQEGRQEHRCTVCNESYTELLPRLAGQEASHQHSWRTETRLADCTHDGCVLRVCGDCGAEETVSTIAKLGHSYTGEVTRPATTEQEGLRTYTCERCGDSYSEAIEKLPAAGGRLESGSTGLSKLSKQEITDLLKNAPLTMPENLFDEEPSVDAPYAAGKVSGEALRAALARLNALRRIAGLLAVTLDESLCENAQYGAVLTAHNDRLNHHPGKVADMDQDFFEKAYAATSTSNLAAGYTLTGSVDGFMDDSDSSNIDRVGHRRWQLNPSMGKVGFGVACSGQGYNAYVVEKVFDRSGAGCDYSYISWPASGNFPSELFDGSTAWSVSLNPGKFQKPNAAQVTVTVTSESGRSWTLRSGGDGYFNVNNAGYGVDNCIIFRPDGISSYDGVYTVSITGLKAADGTAAELTFQTDFFSAGGGAGTPGPEPQQPQNADRQESQKPQDTVRQEPQKPAQNTNQPAQNTGNVFSDVSGTHWAADDIRTAVKRGIVNGYADGSFRPAARVTNAHFHVMLARAFYQEELALTSGDQWWSAAVSANSAHSLLDGTALASAQGGNAYGTVLNTAISRNDMAQIMYNLLKDRQARLPDDWAREAARNAISDWSSIPENYREAVSVCYAMGLLNGRADGTFGGSAVMNRAQGCTVICRLWSRLEE